MAGAGTILSMLDTRDGDPVASAVAANKRLFLSALTFSAAMSILALTTSFYMLQVYDRVLTSRSEETLLLLTLITIGGIAVFGILDSLRMRLLNRAGMRVGEALARTTLRAMIATASQDGGLSTKQGLRDIDTVRNFIGSAGFAALLDAPFVVVFLIVLFLLHPAFLVIVLLGGILLGAIALTGHRLTNEPVARSIGMAMRAHQFADNAVRNADVIEGMGMAAGYTERWHAQWLESLRLNTVATDRESAFNASSKALRLLVQILLLGAGALLILSFHATGGIMIGASIIGSRALAPIETMVSMWKSVIAVTLARRRIAQLLLNAPRRDEGIELPAPRGHLSVQAVHYAAPGTRKLILSNIGFELRPGESLGIIGPSGSGKSTLAKLLIGAWPCSSGTVRLDGADIYRWPRAELSRHIGYLPQDVELFAGTVRENIGRMTEGTPSDIVRAAQRAHAHEMILGLPKGYDTEIGENGHNLSGGQSQRIGIARALFGEPRFIVLDEPNSNLDAIGEDALITTLAELKRDGVTVVVVAHRPSILAGVDRMLVLNAAGNIEAFGPRADIVQRYTQQRPASNVVPLSSVASPDADDGNAGRKS